MTPKTIYAVLREFGMKPEQSRDLLKRVREADLRIIRESESTQRARWLEQQLSQARLRIVNEPPQTEEQEVSEHTIYMQQLMRDTEPLTECEKCGQPYNETRERDFLAGYCGGDFCQHDPAYERGD